MKKFVFKTIMDNEVIQKTIIFADAVNLSITGWKPANTEEHPYRILFFSYGSFCGYIDVELWDSSREAIKTEMPFIFWTPFGKVTGFFSMHYKHFCYELKERQGSFTNLAGVLNVRSIRGSGGSYDIASSLSLTDLEHNCITVKFNSLNSYYDVKIVKTAKDSHEEVLTLALKTDKVGIRHYDFMGFANRQDLSKISMDLSKKPNAVPIEFYFLSSGSYQKETPLNLDKPTLLSRYSEQSFLDFDWFAEEISENDPRMFAFIDEVRNDLTLLANGVTPVCIYDKLARLCFNSKSNKFKLDFTGAKDTNIVFKQSMILNKMETRNKDGNNV